jgi:hypothetical protein
MPPPPPRELPDSNLQSLSRTTNFVRREVFRAEVLFSSAMPTHAEKHTGWGGRRVLFPLKRANTAAFGLCDPAARRAGRCGSVWGVYPVARARTQARACGPDCDCGLRAGAGEQKKARTQECTSPRR